MITKGFLTILTPLQLLCPAAATPTATDTITVINEDFCRRLTKTHPTNSKTYPFALPNMTFRAPIPYISERKTLRIHNPLMASQTPCRHPHKPLLFKRFLCSFMNSL